MGDIREEAFGKREKRRSGSGRGRRGVWEETKKEMPSRFDRAMRAKRRIFQEGRCNGGPHMRLSRRTGLVGVSLASGVGQLTTPNIVSCVIRYFMSPGNFFNEIFLMNEYTDSGIPTYF